MAGGAGTRELCTRGGRPARPPAPGELARAAGRAARRRVAGRARRGRPRLSGALAFFAARCAVLAACSLRDAASRRARAGAARAVARARSRALADALVRAGREGRDPGARRAPPSADLPAPPLRSCVGARDARAAARVSRSRAAGPLAVARVLAARRERYRRAVDAGAPEMAVAIADALGGGHSLRAALGEAARRLGGAGGSRAPPHGRGAGRRSGAPRTRSRRCAPQRARRGMDTLVAACLLQRARRRRPRPPAARQRPLRSRTRRGSRARSARPPPRRASRRCIVVLLPLGGALLAELASPGWFAGCGARS